MSLSTDLAQSQQEANELWGKSSPSSPASTAIDNSGDELMAAAGGFSRPLAVSLEVGTGIHGLARHIRDGCPESQVGGFEAPLFMEDR